VKIPGLLLLKPVQYGIGLVAIVGVVGVWYRGKINDAKDQAIADFQSAANDTLQARNKIVRDSADAVVKKMADTLLAVQLRADVARRSTIAASANYDAQRRLVNTSAPQPAGVPAGSVIVPIAFVVAADSAIKMLPILLTQAALERAASQQQIEALRFQHTQDTIAIRLVQEQNAQLRAAIEAAKPGLLDRAKGYAIGGVIVYAAVTLLGGRN